MTIPLLVDRDALQKSELDVLAAHLVEMRERYAGVAVTEVVEPTTPARLILDQAMDAQLVVVGSHGHGRLAGAILGSVSQHLLRHSPCPIMIHRAPHHSNA